jgi:hypothetical protein
METAYPHLVPPAAIISVSNILPSGAAFGVRLDDGTSCYIPLRVASTQSLRLGDDFLAKLVPNRFTKEDNRTPWLAVHLTRSTVAAPAYPVQYAMPFEEGAGDPELPPIEDRVRVAMQSGGVWTDRTMFDHLFPGATRGTGSADFLTVRNALRQMFTDDECAKFAMWHRAGQGHPSRVWYTCYPDRADVDEWEEA